jgi:hypothetical protein
MTALLILAAACGTTPGASGEASDGGPAASEPGGGQPASGSTPAEPGGEDPGAGEPSDGGGVSEPDPEIPTEEEFLSRLEPIIASMTPPNATEVNRSLEEELVLFVEWESSDSYETLDAHYAAVTPPAGMDGGGGPTDFPESSSYTWFGNNFEIGVSISGSRVIIGFLGIPPAN